MVGVVGGVGVVGVVLGETDSAAGFVDRWRPTGVGVCNWVRHSAVGDCIQMGSHGI